jgi:hypothetical protein
LAQVQQLLAECGRQCRLVGLMGAALCRLLSLTKSPESVIPLACECGRRKTVRRIAVLVAASGPSGGKAGLTHLLLLGDCQPLALTLALRQHLVSGLELRGRHGVEKGLPHESFDRGAIEMGTSGGSERPPHARADLARVATIMDMHLAPTETARGQALQEGRAFARHPPPPTR